MTWEARPGQDEYPWPESELTPIRLAKLAEENAEKLASGYPLDYEAAEQYMGALTGLYNGGTLCSDVYDRMSSSARRASRRLAVSVMKYFIDVGQKEEIESEFQQMDSRVPMGITHEAWLIKKMHLHVSISAAEEAKHIQVVPYNSIGIISPDTEDADLWLDLDRADFAFKARRQNPREHYDEQGIRRVLQVFGISFRPILTGVVEVRPLPQWELTSLADSLQIPERNKC